MSEPEYNLDAIAAALNRVVDDTAAPDNNQIVSLDESRDPQREQFIQYLQSGGIPVLPSVPLSLYPGEIPHFLFDRVTLIERRVVSQKVVGRSAGITLFSDDLAFSFGESESHLVSRRADVPVATGTLFLSSLRLVFVAPGAGISLLWPEILDAGYCRSELLITPANAAMVRLHHYDPELVAWCVSACQTRSRASQLRQPR